jgi:alpha-L-arabinofuranosidase
MTTVNNTSLASAEVVIQTDQPKPISSDLFGIFFEDINYAADGGLYAELIQNRSFAYTSADHPDWNFFTGWELIQRGGRCSVTLGNEEPIHPNNPHYLLLNVEAATGEIGIKNTGFAGIALKAGEQYNFSIFARVLAGTFEAIKVRLESREGAILGESVLSEPSGEWRQFTTTIQPNAEHHHARLVVLISGTGTLALDMVSLFPQATFHNRANGLRADLAQVIGDLKPKFMRFPGGCLAHGDGLDNMYRWKDTIGLIETRKEQFNIWNYHQSVGLGYYEYFQFCEDIGAKPVPIVPAGVCCPNTGARYNGRWEEGQEGLPMEEMPDYVQEVLDLIEWANGPATSTWGAKRAEAGHPEPFGLEYLGVGNEDRITPMFKVRFKMIYDAVKAKHPEITVIGTTGPRPAGEDYELGWQFANEIKLDMVDEHGHKEPEWFWDNLQRFDAYDRNASKVYLGEYAAHDLGRKNTLRSALAEAAYMTSLERNGDIVSLSSYAPLLAKQRYTQWTPDLIYFDNVTITPTINYYVQQLFSVHAGDVYLPTTVTVENDANELAISCVQDSQSGDIIVKVVSRADVTVQARLNFAAIANIQPTATCIVLSGDPLADNPFGRPASSLPQTTEIAGAPQFTYKVPAHSLSVIRLKTR